MKSILSKIQFKKTSLLMVSFGLVFFANTQSLTETQVFTAQGSDSNPAVITINIPNDITVNNGVGIQSIVISNVVATVDVGGGFPIGGFLNCGDIYTYNMSIDGTPTYIEKCEAEIQGEDLTNNSTIELSSFAESAIPGFPFPIIPSFDIEIELTLKITYVTCSADAGENTTITPCKNEPIILMDVLDGTPQIGGTWKDPNGDEVSAASITSPNLAGQYSYTYKVEESSNCTNEATLIIDVQDCDYLSVGVQQLESVLIYPNPTNNNINIKGIADGEYKIAIIDLSGRIVQPTRTYSANTTLNLSNIQNGIYFVRVTKDNSEKIFRIVKQ